MVIRKMKTEKVIKCPFCDKHPEMITPYFYGPDIGEPFSVDFDDNLIIKGYVHLPPGCGRSWEL